MSSLKTINKMAIKPPDGSEVCQIKEVWAQNIEEESAKLKELILRYRNVSMDTEFPGNYFKRPPKECINNEYDLLKCNVDELNLIQLGITLSDDEGNMPFPTNTWQFNLRYDLE